MKNGHHLKEKNMSDEFWFADVSRESDLNAVKNLREL